MLLRSSVVLNPLQLTYLIFQDITSLSSCQCVHQAHDDLFKTNYIGASDHSQNQVPRVSKMYYIYIPMKDIFSCWRWSTNFLTSLAIKANVISFECGDSPWFLPSILYTALLVIKLISLLTVFQFSFVPNNPCWIMRGDFSCSLAIDASSFVAYFQM